MHSVVLESDQLDVPAQPGAARMALDALRIAARTRTFWALVAGFAICGATTNGLIGTHFVPAAHDHGMGETTAAGLLAVVGIFDIVGTIGSGWLTDRVDPRLLLVAYYFFRGIGLALLPVLLSDAVHPSIVAFVVIYGLELGGDRAARPSRCAGSRSAHRVSVMSGLDRPKRPLPTRVSER